MTKFTQLTKLRLYGLFFRVFLQCNNSQRGVGRGQWGEESVGATVKDTRTKSRGRVEVGGGKGGGGRWDWLGWGENAENCN